ncbi:hypothetical protein TWF281_005872 [Arthrobotrys megalospora]
MPFRKFVAKLLTPSKSGKRWSLGSSSSEQPTPPPTEIEYDENPYNMFLLCPKHADPELILNAYEDEMAHILSILDEKPNPGLSGNVARGELARRTPLTKDMKWCLQRRMEELQVAKTILLDPKQKAIADKKYGDQANCQRCIEPDDTGEVSVDACASGLMSHPRPLSKQWRESNIRRRDFYDF